MSPKPLCRTLLYIYGWKNFIEEKLNHLENHSRFNSFVLSRENNEVRLRAKQLPQDHLLVPRAGIRLLKPGIAIEPIGAAEFRLENINFDKIMKGIDKLIEHKTLPVRMRVNSSWDNLRSSLERLPLRRSTFEKMDLSVLPTLPEDSSSSETSPLINNEQIPELIGEHCDEDVNEGYLDDEVKVNMDVCIYTAEKKSRPWVGRIVEILSNRQFILQWYTRKSIRSLNFTALSNPDGSPALATLSYDNSYVLADV